MELAIRDHKIFQIKAEIENRKKLLCAKRQMLRKTVKENEFLNDILNDYEQYNKHIISQKEKQIVFLERLNQYIINITTDLQMTDNRLRDSNREQREITKEISMIKRELDDLVKNNEY
jgi:septal ring factor EnvC (AmiA/AmiB activator)